MNAGRGLWLLTLAASAVAATAAGCDGGRQDPAGVGVPGKAGAVKASAISRAARRAYDGAPPVIPHVPFQITCVQCHDARGMAVAGVGFAPPSPHDLTSGMSSTSRCQQCHVFQSTKEVFVDNGFEGAPQDLRKGDRLYNGAPPVTPHGSFLRENCLACHAGPAAREELRTTHPERTRCVQCHATPHPAVAEGEEFRR